MKVALLALVALFLTGCKDSISQEQITLIIRKCPALINYSKQEQQVALKELRAIQSDAQIAKMMADYSKLRAACRIQK
jgi:hypothetical protein